MTKKWKFVVFKALFLLEVHIQQRWYLTGENSSRSFIRSKKTEHFRILRKSIMAAQKCKNILLQTALKDFWSSANPKLKKLNLPKLSLLLDYTEENARMGVLGSYFCLYKLLKILLHSDFSENLTSKVWEPFDDVMKPSDLATMTSILMNQQWLNSVTHITLQKF